MRMCILTLCVGLVLSSSALAAPAPASPAATEAANLRNTVGQSVCQVTVINKWAIPLAHSTGFLLGDGRFVITDLGAVAQPGAALAQFQFIDGTKEDSWAFGFADPALGLVALRVKTEAPTRTGLSLAQTLPALETLANVTAMGWRWGKQLDWVSGKLLRGPTIKEIAKRAQIETPPGVDAFLRMDGPRIEAATGSPVVDATGAVLAVRLDVDMRDALALAMPAPSLRQSLMAAQPEIKVLAELPKPLWPLPVLRVKGEVPTLQEVAGGVPAIKQSLVCKLCGGKGKQGRLFHPWQADESGNCLLCQGSGLAPADGALPNMVAWVEQATRGAWAPTLDDRVRMQIRSAGLDVLRPLAGSTAHFRRLFGLASLGVIGELLRPNPPFPRGMVFFARVRDVLDGPGGRFLILDTKSPPWDTGPAPPKAAGKRPGDDVKPAPGKAAKAGDSGTIAPQGPPDAAAAPGADFTVAVRADDMTTVKGRKEPAQDSWIVVAGSIISYYKADAYSGWAVLPLEWLPAPLPPKKP